jgi:hypothetical protein
MLDASNAFVTLATVPGMTLSGTLQVGSICVTALPNQPTQIVPLLLSSPSAAKSDGTSLANVASSSGQIVVVGGQTYLQLVAVPGNDLLQLNLYGSPGTNYTLETALRLEGPWSSVTTMNFTNSPQQTLMWTNHGEAASFFRLHQQ